MLKSQYAARGFLLAYHLFIFKGLFGVFVHCDGLINLGLWKPFSWEPSFYFNSIGAVGSLQVNLHHMDN